MRSLHTTMHPGVMPPDTRTRARYQRGSHLLAGSLDGACAVYALWSALITLGVARRAHVHCLRFGLDNDKFGEAWLQGLETFFLGSDDDDMSRLLATVKRHITHERCHGSMRAQIEFATTKLRAGDVVMIGLQGLRTEGGHWSLAIGIEELVSQTATKAIGLLCLDSSEAAPSMLRFNARLELNSPHHGATYVRYRLASGDARTMKITSAIALGRRPVRTRNSARSGAKP